jgi:hypothetical protein
MVLMSKKSLMTYGGNYDTYMNTKTELDEEQMKVSYARIVGSVFSTRMWRNLILLFACFVLFCFVLFCFVLFCFVLCCRDISGSRTRSRR